MCVAAEASVRFAAFYFKPTAEGGRGGTQVSQSDDDDELLLPDVVGSLHVGVVVYT